MRTLLQFPCASDDECGPDQAHRAHHQTDSAATLFVTYLASGDCGTVVMERSATEWIINELSEECAT